MGYYIDTGTNKGKVQYIINQYGATKLDDVPLSVRQLPNNLALICVVENEHFDAAVLCHDDQELNRFEAPDAGLQRPRTWLTMDKPLAHKLSGFKE